MRMVVPGHVSTVGREGDAAVGQARHEVTEQFLRTHRVVVSVDHQGWGVDGSDFVLAERDPRLEPSCGHDCADQAAFVLKCIRVFAFGRFHVDVLGRDDSLIETLGMAQARQSLPDHLRLLGDSDYHLSNGSAEYPEEGWRVEALYWVTAIEEDVANPIGVVERQPQREEVADRASDHMCSADAEDCEQLLLKVGDDGAEISG